MSYLTAFNGSGTMSDVMFAIGNWSGVGVGHVPAMSGTGLHRKH